MLLDIDMFLFLQSYVCLSVSSGGGNLSELRVCTIERSGCTCVVFVSSVEK